MIRSHGAIFCKPPALSSGGHHVHYQQVINRVESGSPMGTSVSGGGGQPFSTDKSQFAIIGPHGGCLMRNPAPNYYVSGHVWAGELLFGHLYAKPMHDRRHACSYCGDANHFFVQFPSVPAHSRAIRVQSARRGTAGPVKEERWHSLRT
ncbi:hypothetical protein CGRA01v4_03104 [Colletotrichum graminicola]|nr:hypothetical protein CGRA01v4_03104 [Colletotrichum graminicola]